MDDRPVRDVLKRFGSPDGTMLGSWGPPAGDDDHSLQIHSKGTDAHSRDSRPRPRFDERTRRTPPEPLIWSGNGNTGTLQGGAAWTNGRFRSALSFDGNAAAVLVPASRSLEPSRVSVSAWVNSSTSPGDFKYIVAQGANGCLASSYGLYTGANGGLQFYASSNQGPSWSISPDAGATVWDGN